MQVKLKGLEKVLKNMDGFPDRIKREIGGEFREAAKEIERLAKHAAPKDQGRLVNTITTKEVNVTKYEVGASSQIAAIQEFGTKKSVRVDPEFASYAMTFKGVHVQGAGTLYENILAWVKRVGLAGTFSTKTRRRTGPKDQKEQQDKRAAFFISRKITREGVTAHPFLMPAFKATKTKLIRRLIKIFRK